MDREAIIEFYEERAAIRQYDGNREKRQAEAGALADVEKWFGTEAKRMIQERNRKSASN